MGKKPDKEKKYRYKENIAKFAKPNLHTIEVMPEIEDRILLWEIKK